MREVDPAATVRAAAFDLWMKAPMPMVTFFKTLAVTRLLRFGRRRGLKFNMLMCFCIGRAAQQIREFYMLPVGEKLVLYERLAVNTIVLNRNGEVNSCDIPFEDNLEGFNERYLDLTGRVARSCENHDEGGSMAIGTSNIAAYEIDGAVNMYSGIFNNPFCIWGKYARKWINTYLKLSFQFHHTQMDGAHAAKFLHLLQKTIDTLE